VHVIAKRYRGRPGGYTRIHKTGHRKGDHAPAAVLELVDGPHDISFFLAAMAVGRSLARRTGGSDPWLVDGLPDFSLLDPATELSAPLRPRMLRQAEALEDDAAEAQEAEPLSAGEAREAEPLSAGEAMEPPSAPSDEQATAGVAADTIPADVLAAAGARWPVLGSTIRSLLDERLVARVDKACRYRSATSLLFFEATAHYHFRRALADPQDAAVDEATAAPLLSGLGQWSEAEYAATPTARRARSPPVLARPDSTRDWRGVDARAV